MSKTRQFVSAGWADYRRLAEQRLPRFLFDYIDGGANEERTMAANCHDFSNIKLRQRVMRDVSQLSTQCTLFGQTAAMPVALAPVGLSGMYARRGEVQAAKAAETAKVPFSLSTVGICSVEEVNQAVSTPSWFQLYMLKDREAVSQTLERAYQAGCRTMLFTVDLAVPGARLRDTRNGMLAEGLLGKYAKLRQLLVRPQWLWDVGIHGKPHAFGNLSQYVANPEDLPAFRAWIDAQFDQSVTWEDIKWVRQQWPGQLIIKGILDAEDALLAIDSGADGLIVSNHGGRQLDDVPSTISQLPALVKTVNQQVPIMLDGGVRTGIDVLKAVALGAQGVLIGRPWAWALGGAGQQGVEQLLADMQHELKIAMALCGVNSIAEITPEVLL